jgi:hypothetical protein
VRSTELDSYHKTEEPRQQNPCGTEHLRFKKGDIVSDQQQAIIAGKSYASTEEIQAYKKLCELNKRSPIPDREVLANLGLFHVRSSCARMLFMHKFISSH